MKSLHLQVMLEAIDKATAPLRKIVEGSNEAAKALKASKQALKDLEKTQENIKGFVSLKKELGDTSRRLDETQKKIREIARTQKTEGYESKTYEATLRKLKEEAKSLTAAKSKQQQQLQQMRGTLEAAGIKTRHLAEHEKRLRADITATNAAIDQQKKQLDELGKVHARMNAIRARAKAIHHGGMVAAGHGVAFSHWGRTQLGQAYGHVQPAMEFEAGMRDIAITGNFSKAAESALAGQIRQDALKYGQTVEAIRSGLGSLVANGIDDAAALGHYSALLAKTSVATHSTMEDLSNLTVTLERISGVAQGDMQTAFDAMNYAAKQGSFEMKDMAKWFPQLMPQMKALGIEGMDAVTQISAALQVGRLGAGSSDEAANNLRNYLAKITSPDTLKAFDNAGIDLQGRLMAMQAKGIAPLQGSLQLITEYMASKGPAAAAQFKAAIELRDDAQRQAALEQLSQAYALGDLFRDAQAMAFLRPALSNRDEMQRIQQGASTAKGGIEGDWVKRMETSAMAVQQFKIRMEELKLQLGGLLLPTLNDLANRFGKIIEWVTAFAHANPGLASGIVKLGAAVGVLAVALGSVLTVGGLATMMFSHVYKAIALLSGGNGLAGLGATAARFFAPLLGGLKAIGAAVAAFAGSIGAPVALVVALIAAVALLIWKYWQPIKAFLGGVWDGLLEGLAPVKDAVMFALEPLMPLFGWIGEAISTVIGWLKEFLTPLDASAETLTTASNAGKALGYAIGTVLGGSIRLLSPLLHGLFTALKTLFEWSPMGIIIRHWTPITGFFSGLWGSIVTLLSGWPARMLQVGMDMVQGFINGIRSKLAGVGEAIASIGQSAIGGLKAILGIRSPSRVFAAIGDDTMAGLDMGLGRSAGGPLQRIRQLGQQLGKAGAGLALGSTLALPAAALDARAPLAPAGQAGVAQHHSYQIHITVQGNGHAPDIAAAVRQEIERIERERRARARARYHDDY